MRKPATPEQRKKYRLANLERVRQQTREAVRRFRKAHPRKSAKQNREAQARFKRRLDEAARAGVVPGDGPIEYAIRPSCGDCGEADPRVLRTMEKSPFVLTQRVECRRCKKRWTRVSE